MNKTLLDKISGTLRNLNSKLTQDEIKELQDFFAQETGIKENNNCGRCLRKWARLYRNYYRNNPRVSKMIIEEDVDKEETALDLAIKTNNELKAILDAHNVEYKSKDTKDILINKVKNIENNGEETDKESTV